MTKELGDYKPDYEEWFEMWNSVLFFPNPNLNGSQIPLFGHQGEMGTIPCHEHRTCKAKVVARTKYPPRVCPGCHADTFKEFQSLSADARERQMWLPSR